MKQIEDIRGTYLEGDVDSNLKRYMRSLEGIDFGFNKRKRKRLKEPKFETKDAQLAWRKEEIRRCKKGFDGMSGKHYFYFHYCRIKKATGGRINPIWRRVDADICSRLESYYRGERKGRGQVTVKPRRIGMSWIAAMDSIHEAIFYSFSNIGVQSKGDLDVKRFMADKVKFIYDNLPAWMRPSSAGGNAQDKLEFSYWGKDEMGKKKKKGVQSVILCKAPSDISWEGEGLRAWKADEAGKVSNFISILSMTLPCLSGDDGLTLEGFPWAFGTVGDIREVGKGIKELYTKSEEYQFDKHLIAGWMGKNLDEYGNEDIANTVLWILNLREEKRKISEKAFFNFVQQYPLTGEEAFLASGANFFDNVILSRRDAELDQVHEDTLYTKGYFQWNVKGQTAIFRPSKQGFVQILEHRQANTYYALASDPYDTKKMKSEDGSSGSTMVLKMPQLIEDEEEMCSFVNDPKNPMDKRKEYALALGDLPVCMIVDDGGDPDKFSEQSAMAAVYYNKSKVLVEKNRGAGMIGWFKRNACGGLLAKKPKSVLKTQQKQSSDIGYYRDPAHKEYDLGLAYSYHEQHINRIFFQNLVHKMMSYDPHDQDKKADEVDAFAISLVQAERMKKKNDKEYRDNGTTGGAVPSWGYELNNGKLRLVK